MLVHDDMHPKGLMICTALRAAMIYQACGLDKKKTSKLFGLDVFFFGDPWENRTPVTAVKGRCLSRLTNGPRVAGIGLEPMTYRV